MEIESKIVTPEPYYEIKIHVIPRDFYGIKQKIYEIYCEFDEDMYGDGNTGESCDFEGDLDTIILYRYPDGGKDYCDRPVEEGIKKVFEYFEIDYELVPNDMEIHLKN